MLLCSSIDAVAKKMWCVEQFRAGVTLSKASSTNEQGAPKSIPLKNLASRQVIGITCMIDGCSLNLLDMEN